MQLRDERAVFVVLALHLRMECHVVEYTAILWPFCVAMSARKRHACIDGTIRQPDRGNASSGRQRSIVACTVKPASDA
jgi:hypothetical protein